MEPKAKHFRKREAVLNCLQNSKEHPSAEWIYSQLKTEYPDISLGTVYRNLALFKQQGLIVSLGTVDGVERFDGETAPHAHFICTRCGKVVDLMQLKIPSQLLEEADRYSQGTSECCVLTFTGICNGCKNKLSHEVEI